MHTNKAALMRTLSRRLPAKAMDPICNLTALLQYAACASLLVNPMHYHDPAQHFAGFAALVATMPQPIPSTIPSAEVEPVQAVGHKLFLIHMGLTSGLELMASYIATEVLNRQNVKVQVGERLVCDSGNGGADAVLDAIIGGAPMQPSRRVAPTNVIQEVSQAGERWSGGKVLVSICANQSMVEATSATSSDLSARCLMAEYKAALVELGKHQCEIMAVVLAPANVTVSARAILDDMFGPPCSYTQVGMKIPQAHWEARLRPFCDGAPGPTWAPEAYDDQGRLHASLRAAWDAKQPYAACLPTLQNIELLADDLFDNPAAEAHAVPESIQSAVRVTSPAATFGAAFLLDREALWRVFGLQDSAWSRTWDRDMPCCKFVNSATGFPCDANASEAVECGRMRYCPPCAAMYQAVVELPSCYFWQPCFEATLQAYFAPAAMRSCGPLVLAVPGAAHV